MDKVTYCVDADPRPTCVLDLVSPDGPYIHHKNNALQEQSHLVHDILDFSVSTGFQAWALEIGQSGIVVVSERASLHAYTIEKRWRVIQWLLPEKQSGHGQNGQDSLGEQPTTLLLKGDPLTLNRKLEDALADRDDATGKLSNLRQMIEMVDVGMFEYDKEGVLLYGNEAFHRLSGVPRGSCEPMAWADWVVEEDYPWLVDFWTQLTKGSSCTFEMRWKGPDPGEKPEGQWVTAACVPTTDETGNVTTVSGCITDISAQKRSHSDAVKRAEALERAQASEMRFSDFVKHSNSAFYNFGMDRKMQYCNREWFEISGHPVVPFEEIEWSTFMNPTNFEIVSKNWETIIRTKKPTKFQFELNRTWSDGHGHEMRASVLSCSYPELGEDGSVVAVSGTLTDITHLQWAEKLQKQRTDEAVEAKRQHETFIDMTCHEIRNPLGAVVHCADMIRSELAEMKALIKVAAKSSPQLVALGERCEAVIESLDSKLLAIAPSLTELNSMLHELQKMFEADAQKRDVILRLQKDLGNVQWAILDTGRLTQVLTNLITNATKFTQKEVERIVTIKVGVCRNPPSERDLDVEFIPGGTARERPHAGTGAGSGNEIYLHFTVSDTGCGFDEEEKSRIFERFSQASPRTHSKYGGSGLGLFISREMVELQGGEIGVRSQPGQGSTFAFYIAARTADAPQSVPRRSSRPLPSRQQTSENAGVKLSILVVEDNLVNQKVLRMQLQKLGHQVHVVSHGGEALSFLQTTSCWKGNSASPIHISVILMDIEMPVMNGLECTRKIREAESEGRVEQHLPIVAVSANAREGQVRHAMECGVDDAISKPFRVADLMPIIERLALKLERLQKPKRTTIVAAEVGDDDKAWTEAPWAGQLTLLGPFTRAEYLTPYLETHQSEHQLSQEVLNATFEAVDSSDTSAVYWHMTALYVLNEHRRQGLGDQLCRKAFEHIEQQQGNTGSELRIVIKPSNGVVLKMYERLGFTVKVGRSTLAEAVVASEGREALPADYARQQAFVERNGLIMVKRVTQE
ncbi:hypothetical protein Q7P37_004889 [Cladosporium fusiforme]